MLEVYLAGSLLKVVKGCFITSVLNTTEKEANMPKFVSMVTGVDKGDSFVPDPKRHAERDKSRYESLKQAKDGPP